MLAVTRWVIRDEKSDTAVEQCVDHCNWVYRTVSAASHAQLVPAWLARLVTRVESSRARDTAFELLERAVRPCLRIIITVILCTPRSLRPPPVYTTRSLICARPYNSVFVIDCNRGIFSLLKIDLPLISLSENWIYLNPIEDANAVDDYCLNVTFLFANVKWKTV